MGDTLQTQAGMLPGFSAAMCHAAIDLLMGESGNATPAAHPLRSFAGGRELSGTLSVAAGTVTVTGIGTAFLAQVRTGDFVLIGSQLTRAAAVESNTALTLEDPHAAGASDAEFCWAGMDVRRVHAVRDFGMVEPGALYVTAGSYGITPGVGTWDAAGQSVSIWFALSVRDRQRLTAYDADWSAVADLVMQRATSNVTLCVPRYGGAPLVSREPQITLLNSPEEDPLIVAVFLQYDARRAPSDVAPAALWR